jgi:hypothetical protein
LDLLDVQLEQISKATIVLTQPEGDTKTSTANYTNDGTTEYDNTPGMCEGEDG